jgi:hypothetical protein
MLGSAQAMKGMRSDMVNDAAGGMTGSGLLSAVAGSYAQCAQPQARSSLFDTLFMQ